MLQMTHPHASVKALSHVRYLRRTGTECWNIWRPRLGFACWCGSRGARGDNARMAGNATGSQTEALGMTRPDLD